MKCHEFHWKIHMRLRERNKLTTKLFLTLTFRLDMCRRSHANDVCNRGTAGNFYIRQNKILFFLFQNASSHIECYFLLLYFTLPEYVLHFFFSFLSNIKINFPSYTHQNKYSLSSSSLLYLFLFFICKHATMRILCSFFTIHDSFCFVT